MTQTFVQASFERCCRLCAEEQDVTIMIFSQEAEAMLLQKKLNRYLLIEVDEDDKLPKNICIQCCTKLQTVCDFIDTARKAQDVLLNRSLMLDQNTCTEGLCLVKDGVQPESENHSNIENYTEMEVSVDPMMVLQNAEEPLSPTFDHEVNMEDVTYLHSVDAENVTIKLIKKAEMPSDSEDEVKTEAVTISPIINDSDNDDKNKDPAVKPFVCRTCKRGFLSELALKNHVWIHISGAKCEKLYKCNTCLEAFDYKFDFISHLKKHRSNGICQLCGRMFRSEKTYVAHMSVHLPSNKAYTCKVCGRSYNTWGSLKTHNVSHSSERPYQCQYCMKTFKRNQDLKFHTNQHTGAKPYKCPFCEKCFASSGNCYSHRSRMHPGKRPDGFIRKSNPPPTLTPRQIATKSTTNNITPANNTKFQCTLCEHSFMKKDNFTYHMYQHTGEKPFACSFCSEKFVTKRGLLIHHDTKHSSKDRPLSLISKNCLLK